MFFFWVAVVFFTFLTSTNGMPCMGFLLRAMAHKLCVSTIWTSSNNNFGNLCVAHLPIVLPNTRNEKWRMYIIYDGLVIECCQRKSFSPLKEIPIIFLNRNMDGFYLKRSLEFYNKKRNEKNMQIFYKLLNKIKRQNKMFSHNTPFTILFIPIAMYSPRS